MAVEQKRKFAKMFIFDIVLVNQIFKTNRLCKKSPSVTVILYNLSSITIEAGRTEEICHAIMACHFSSTFLTKHDPDWSQKTHVRRLKCTKMIYSVQRFVQGHDYQGQKSCIDSKEDKTHLPFKRRDTTPKNLN